MDMDRLSQSQKMLWKRELSAYKFEFLAVLENNPPSEISDDIEQLISLRKQLDSSDDIVLTERGMKKYDTAYGNLLSYIKSYSEKKNAKKHSLFNVMNNSVTGFNSFSSIAFIFMLMALLLEFAFLTSDSSNYNILIIGLLGFSAWQIQAIAKARIESFKIIAISKTQFTITYIRDLLLKLVGITTIYIAAVLFLSEVLPIFTTDDGAIIGLLLVALLTFRYKQKIQKQHQAFHWLCAKDKS